MLQSDYLQVSESPTLAVFQDRLVQFANKLGFGLVSAALVVDRTQAESVFLAVGNTPQGFVEASKSVAASRRDPVLKRMKRLNTPVIFDQSTFVDEGAGDLWEEQAPFGYHTGIAMALHLPEGRHFLLGVDREKPLPNRGHRLTRMVAELQLLAVYAQDTAQRLLAPHQLSEPRPSLTSREVEILRWTMEGKSIWAVGQILSISEHTVSFHLRNAMGKLECSSKHLAAAKALRLGLI